MREKQFINAVANGKSDVIQILLDILAETSSSYCVIGGLAVNAYVEPLVSLDLDIVVAIGNIQAASNVAEKRELQVERFEHSINLKSPNSDLRIQLQTDPRYQDFIPRAELKDVLGYKMMVAKLEDVLQGKIWAYMDESRRKSKRLKDLADILRLIESYPILMSGLPPRLLIEIKDK